MGDKKIHSVIDGKNLDDVVNIILDLGSDEENQLQSAAALARLAAVARGRESDVFSKIPSLFTKQPPSIETLVDGDEKYYASVAVRYAEKDWITDYCIKEGVNTDKSEKARKELFNIALYNSADLSDFLLLVSQNTGSVKDISSMESRATRIRRIFTTISEVANDWDGECGPTPGNALNKCFKSLIKNQIKEAKRQTLFQCIDATLAVLQRIISLRFSHAFTADTYTVISSCKNFMGLSNWSSYLNESTVINNVRISLLEAVVVLAKQNRTDNAYIQYLTEVFGDTRKVEMRVREYFTGHPDIDPETAEWWSKAGNIKKSRRQAEHKVGGSEDQQIGALMIEVETIKETMDKLGRAIVPFLEIHDPVLASTVKKSAAGYENISRISRQLGRMRKLTITNLKGEWMEYNPQLHEMLGGHKSGVRNIKVVRDGIQKDFGGKIKTIVKCWVEPTD
jgi:hypothetical protein